MKRLALITILTTAVVILLSIQFVPHHHHNGALCTIIEHCDIDDTENDYHTHHHGDQSSCVENSHFIVGKSDLTSHVADMLTLHFTSLLPLLYDNLIEDIAQSVEVLFPDVIVSRYVAEIADYSGLRAPPADAFRA